MDNLQTALALLEKEFGELDNIKLLLGGGEGMTTDSVAIELLKIARDISVGDLVAKHNYPEPHLADSIISI